MFKNMKIEINEAQPLDDVVKELDRLGYSSWNIGDYETKMIVTWEDGLYSNYDEYETHTGFDYSFPLLNELKEMKCKI